ncbi:MAG: XdhC family protein [Bacteroidota bacterium]|nr:XdhC family protein [Bacteroidota bacterium]
MIEIQNICEAYDRAVKTGKKSALATVVKVDGSSYRRPGARMLVTEDGQLTGAISGGCLEGDALRKAVLAITQDTNKLVIYDTTDEEDARVGIQLGCNGIVSILFEPIDPGNPDNPIEVLRKSVRERKSSVIITAYSKNRLEHYGTRSVNGFPMDLQDEIAAICHDVCEKQVSVHQEFNREDNQLVFFFAFTLPPIALILVGAGNDVMPLYSMAKLLGWKITLVDGRNTHANRQRFPLADEIIVAKAAEAMVQVTPDQRTALVLMTHNYQYDLACLAFLSTQNIPYIGLLGPAAKRDRLFAELEDSGVTISDTFLDCVYGPTGLDLGAETAEEIALSVSAEILAVMQKQEPVHLRNKSERIHDLPG